MYIYIYIDWVQDATNNNTSVNIPKFLVPISSWLVFSIVGIFIGLISGLISITTVWLANIKIGKCTYDLLKFQKVCQDWSEWTKFEFVNYLFYVFLSVSFIQSILLYDILLKIIKLDIICIYISVYRKKT